MPSPTRRDIVNCSVILTSGFAGCTESYVTSPQETTLLSLSAANFDPEAHTIHVLLEHNGQQLYRKSAELPPFDPDTNRVEGNEFEDIPTDPNPHMLYAWRDEQPQSEWKEFDIRNWDNQCLQINIYIGEMRQRLRGNVTIWKTADCNL